ISTLDVIKIKFKNGRVRVFANHDKYPQSEKKQFIESCLKNENASYPYCLCSFLKIESKYSFADISQYSIDDPAIKDLIKRVAISCATEIKDLNLLKSLPINDSEYTNLVLPMIAIEINKSCP